MRIGRSILGIFHEMLRFAVKIVIQLILLFINVLLFYLQGGIVGLVDYDEDSDDDDEDEDDLPPTKRARLTS